MKLKKQLLKIIYFLCLTVILFISMCSSTIAKKYISIDNIKYDNYPFDNIPMDKVNMWIKIPTYDKSNQTTHPKVLYFKNGFNGYKYWMVHTPYPGNDAYLENPSMAVSNDGVNFIEPAGLKNPISGYPTTYRSDSYYSDPFMLFDNDHFELFFRKTRSVLNGIVDINGYNYMYIQTSNDGLTWTKPKQILGNNPPERYMSMSVIKENELYKMWYVNYDGKVRYIETVDFKNYTNPVTINIENFKKKVWHGEIQYINNKYVYIFMIKYQLYYTESNDGINFIEPRLIETDMESLKGKRYNIYKTTYIIGDDYIELYIPYGINHIWNMYYKKIPIDQLFEKNT